MSYEEEFDKIIRQKAEEANYGFDERHWDKARQLIDEDRAAAAKIRFKSLYLPGALILILGGLSVWTLIYFMNPAVETEEQRNELMADASVSMNVSQPFETGNGSIHPASSSPKKSIPQPVTKNNALKTGSAPEKHNSPIVSARQLPAVPAIESQRSTTAAEPVQQTALETTTTKEMSNSAGQQPAEEPTVVMAGGDAAGQDSEIAAQDNVDAEAPAMETEAGETSISLLYPFSAALTSSVTDYQIRTSPFVLLARYDDYFQTTQRKKHYLNIEAGTFYTLGWQTAAGTDGKGLNGFGGLNYGRYLSQRSDISVGLQFYQVNHITQPFFNQVKTSYDFGSVTGGSTIISKSLYYLALPLRFSYAFNNAGRLSAGVNAAYLFRSDNNLQSYTVLDNMRTVTGESSDNFIYNDQRAVNLSLTAAYRINVQKRLALNAEFMYGLTDVFANNRTVRNDERTTGFRLSLQYLIFDK